MSGRHILCCRSIWVHAVSNGHLCETVRIFSVYSMYTLCIYDCWRGDVQWRLAVDSSAQLYIATSNRFYVFQSRALALLVNTTMVSRALPCREVGYTLEHERTTEFLWVDFCTGYFIPYGTTVYYACPPGYFSSAGRTSCTLADSGTFAPLPASSSTWTCSGSFLAGSKFCETGQ